MCMFHCLCGVLCFSVLVWATICVSTRDRGVDFQYYFLVVLALHCIPVSDYYVYFQVRYVDLFCLIVGLWGYIGVGVGYRQCLSCLGSVLFG